jgi:ribosomal protein S18 acetylase RimI-like enzyme
MHIREANPNDKIEITKMYRNLYDEEFSKKSLIPIEHHRLISKIFLAQEKNKKIGFIWINYIEHGNSKYGYIEELYVKPEYRNKGIGTTLVTRAKNFFIEKSVQAIFVSINNDNNRVIDFYKNQDFHECKGLWFYFTQNC